MGDGNESLDYRTNHVQIESAFKNLKTSYWPSSRASSKKKEKPRASSGTSRINPASSSFANTKKQLTDYLNKVKKSE